MLLFFDSLSRSSILVRVPYFFLCEHFSPCVEAFPPWVLYTFLSSDIDSLRLMMRPLLVVYLLIIGSGHEIGKFSSGSCRFPFPALFIISLPSLE